MSVMLKEVGIDNLISKPSHVFKCMREKSGRSAWFGDVMMTYLPLFLPQFCRNGGRYVITSPNWLTGPPQLFSWALKRPWYEARDPYMISCFVEGSRGIDIGMLCLVNGRDSWDILCYYITISVLLVCISIAARCLGWIWPCSGSCSRSVWWWSKGLSISGFFVFSIVHWKLVTSMLVTSSLYAWKQLVMLMLVQKFGS